MIDPSVRDRRSRKWKRWERGAPMELWQTDIVGGFPLADGTSAKALTGIDDHPGCACAATKGTSPQVTAGVPAATRDGPLRGGRSSAHHVSRRRTSYFLCELRSRRC